MANNKKDVTAVDQAQIRRLGQKLIKRHRNLWVYMVFGFVAALINTLVFMVLHSWWHNVMVISNTIAFIVSNLASFWFNQKAVFINNVDHEHSTWHKLIVFFTYRVISLIPDTLIMLVGLSWLHLNALLVKIIDQILVGVFNYLTTRSVFQKQEHTMIERAKMRIQEQKNKETVLIFAVSFIFLLKIFWFTFTILIKVIINIIHNSISCMSISIWIFGIRHPIIFVFVF